MSQKHNLEWLHKMPKSELHIHLEGALSVDTIEELASDHNTPLLRPKENFYGNYKDLAEFLEMLDWLYTLVHTKEEAGKVSYAYAKYAHAHNIVYAEVLTDLDLWVNIPPKIMMEGVLEGFDRAFADGYTDCSFVPSLRRTESNEAVAHFVEIMLGTKHPRLVGMGLDGEESLSPGSNKRLGPLLKPVKKAGFGLTAHAGESSGPEGVREAIEILGADRIDHGVRGIEDPKVVALVVEKQIPLNIAYRSNLFTSMYEPHAHPVAELYRKGCPVNLSTDDPMCFGNVCLEAEILEVATQFNLSKEDIVKMQENAIKAAFCKEEKREKLRQNLSRFITDS